MKINKIPGIVVVLLPLVLFGLYIGVTSWMEWISYDTVIGNIVLRSKEDKIQSSLVAFCLTYGLLCLIFDRNYFEKPVLSIPVVYPILGLFWIFKQLIGFLTIVIEYINKYLTINLNKDER